MKKFVVFALILSFLLTVPVVQAEDTRQTIQLSSAEAEGKFTHSATLDGKEVPQYDYTWHIDPTKDHAEVKNSPAEYYTGTKPSGEDAVYIAHDIYYYPQIDQSRFQLVDYDGEKEWVSFYEAPGLQVGKTYNLYVGGDVTGTEVSGVYNAASVIGFTGATQQGISSNSVGGMGRPNGNFERPNKGERPEGFTPPEATMPKTPRKSLRATSRTLPPTRSISTLLTV